MTDKFKNISVSKETYTSGIILYIIIKVVPGTYLRLESAAN